MKRMAATLAVMGALSAVGTPAAAAATASSSEGACLSLLVLRFC